MSEPQFIELMNDQNSKNSLNSKNSSSDKSNSTNPPLTAKTGIVWFGNHTRSKSTEHSKKQAQPGVFFGYFLFDGQKESNA
jgi:hypothetical protein